MEKKEEHLIKRVSKELGLTYRELGEKIGYSEGTLRRCVSKNELSTQLKKAIELYLELENTKKNEKELKENKERIVTLLKGISKKISKEI